MLPPSVDVARKVLEVVDVGLCSGLGRPEPGHMCVEAAVCYALGEPHGAEPTCVGSAVRAFEISLNDAPWPSNAERAAGMREVAICQLGSNAINQTAFATEVALRTVREILPIALRGIGLEAEASACESAADLSAAAASAESAKSASASVASAAAASAELSTRVSVLKAAAKIGAETLRKCACPGVHLWDSIK